jgi:crotonobetainyl-CoA:carnitine CoA-transferase CaiB-like acyl-CoA transferase
MVGVDAVAVDWAGSGLAYLTGAPDGPPDFSRAAVLSEARRVTATITQLVGGGVDAATLLAGRAALLGLSRRGRISAGGATRLLATTDSWCAIALPRADDIAALPALLQSDIDPDDPWPALTRWAATSSAEAVVSRAQLLDIAAAVLRESSAGEPVIRRCGIPTEPRRPARLLVADLSSLWAGPLCGQLLARAGAVVVKVESPARPDGTRRGKPAFFDWINYGKLCYAADFEADNDGLRDLLAVADVVIEGSRPAALRRRRLSVDDIPARPGRVWLRISGHVDQPDRPAFGDDAAVAGGLVGAGPTGPVFCGDAIADPLTGLEATRAVAESLLRGGGELIDVSMAAVAARYAALPQKVHGVAPIVPPRRPPPSPPAPPLGADNSTVRRMISERLAGAC